ncbi:MAG TPA: hypothetical protein VHY31_22335 [Streptosporangiaceae bacterium]|nr:hypothetical protein [Streptosporangiaceae bacterium]
MLVLIIVLIALSVLFGGFQKGTKTGGLGPAPPVRISAAGGAVVGGGAVGGG